MTNLQVSVIIPTANRPQSLARLILQLSRQSMKGDMEIIVVDDYGNLDSGSIAGTEAECKVLLIRGGRRGPAHARNAGALHAKGDNLVFLDDDTEIDTGYISRLLQELEVRPNHAVAGPQRSAKDAGFFALASEWLADHFSQSQYLGGEEYRFAASNGLALRKHAFQTVGGFDSQFPSAAGEDRDFCARWLDAGGRIAVLNRLAIRHHFPSTASAFWAQQWRYGRGAAQLSTLNRNAASVRSMGFYVQLIWFPIRRLGLRKGVRVALGAATAQLAVLLGYAYQRCCELGARQSRPIVC
jgi:GT2 family glycosyltransferase